MTYSDFTLADVMRTFHLTMDDEHDLFTSVHEVLEQDTIRLDRQEHYLDQVGKILGILVHMVSVEPVVTA